MKSTWRSRSACVVPVRVAIIARLSCALWRRPDQPFALGALAPADVLARATARPDVAEHLDVLGRERIAADVARRQRVRTSAARAYEASRTISTRKMKNGRPLMAVYSSQLIGPGSSPSRKPSSGEFQMKCAHTASAKPPIDEQQAPLARLVEAGEVVGEAHAGDAGEEHVGVRAARRSPG